MNKMAAVIKAKKKIRTYIRAGKPDAFDSKKQIPWSVPPAPYRLYNRMPDQRIDRSALSDVDYNKKVLHVTAQADVP